MLHTTQHGKTKHTISPLCVSTDFWALKRLSARLTASDAVNYHILHVANIYFPANIRIQDVGCHELLKQLYLTPEDGLS